jgi:hypothetical protein
MKGEVVYLYAFDVAQELVTSGIEQVLSEKPARFDVRLDHTYPKDIPLYKPLAIQPPSLTEDLFGEKVNLQVRLYDMGVTIRAPFERDNLESLLPFHDPILENGTSLDEVARRLCAEVCRQLERLLVGLSELDQLYSVVNSELNERRMLWMELAIVILFILDLLAIAFF